MGAAPFQNRSQAGLVPQMTPGAQGDEPGAGIARIAIRMMNSQTRAHGPIGHVPDRTTGASPSGRRLDVPGDLIPAITVFGFIHRHIDRLSSPLTGSNPTREKAV